MLYCLYVRYLVIVSEDVFRGRRKPIYRSLWNDNNSIKIRRFFSKIIIMKKQKKYTCFDKAFVDSYAWTTFNISFELNCSVHFYQHVKIKINEQFGAEKWISRVHQHLNLKAYSVHEKVMGIRCNVFFFRLEDPKISQE